MRNFLDLSFLQSKKNFPGSLRSLRLGDFAGNFLALCGLCGFAGNFLALCGLCGFAALRETPLLPVFAHGIYTAEK
jgi:hypothetical protein